MNYINFEYLVTKELTINDYIYLQMIAQKTAHLLPEDEGFYSKFISEGLAQTVKGKESINFRIRISKKGKQLLDKIAIPHYTEGVEELIDSLEEIYEVNGLESRVGQRSELISRYSWFMGVTGFKSPVIKSMVEDYVQDLVNSNRKEYVMSLPNLAWRGEGVYNSNFYLTQSKLYDLICNKYGLDQNIKYDNTKKGRTLQFLFVGAQLMPVKNLEDDSLYFTGTYEGDLAHSNKLKKVLVEMIKKDKDE